MDKIRKLYIDQPSWQKPIKTDDFIIAIGVKQSNSVYHVLESNPKPNKDIRLIRYYIKVFNSDLQTALRRGESQQLIPITWYSRNKN